MGRHLAALLAVVATGCVEPAGASDGTGTAPCTGKCDGSTVSVASLRNNLLAHLMAQMDTGTVLFGHQRSMITGVNADGTQWLATEGNVDRSDAKSVTGHHPAVMGFDAWDLAIKPETWAPSPAVHAEAAKHFYAAGGVVAMDWHIHGCAVDSFDAAGNEACLCRLANDDAFARSWLLGNYAKLADALVRFGLDRIPMVFRPLHEQNGGWFWWGQPYWNCAAVLPAPSVTGEAAYQRIYQTIVTYLRVERGLDNLLFAYSPDRFGGANDAATGDEHAYLAGYPGDEFVDILGIDLYYDQRASFAAQTTAFRGYLATIARLARARGKAAALTEVGNTQLATETTPAQSRWFSEQLLPLIESAPLAYASTWENRTNAPQQFWLPYPTHPGDADLRAFEANAATLFLDDVPDLYSTPSDGYPVCASCTSDPDGDRWGWENGRSCRVASWCLPATVAPVCELCSSDPDGDGWGWEHDKSCRILATCR